MVRITALPRPMTSGSSSKVSTDGIPVDQRLSFWREVTSQTFVPLDTRCESQLESSFQARLEISALGPVQAALMTGTPHAVHRTSKLIHQNDPELCKLSLCVRGSGAVVQDDRQAELMPGDLVIYETSRPYSGRLNPGISTSQMLILQFERSLFPLPPRALRQLTAARIPGDQGIGALTSGFLLQLARRFEEYSPADTARLSSIALNLLAAAFAHALDADTSVPPETRQRALTAQILAFIEQNLGDPELRPGAIAAAHHISIRYLHKLFHEHGDTVAAWIRERRLERCRRDLADPLLGSRPISAIAARWGFTSPAHFSQAFRSANGLSPRQFRERSR
jgi:AraC-like DNA-binding protein